MPSNPKTLQYNRFELYMRNSYDLYATPTIDGISYLTSNLAYNALIKIRNFNDSTSSDVRQWVAQSFIFNKLSYNLRYEIQYEGYWKYTDLYWYPGPTLGSFGISTFTPRRDTVYVVLFPC
jgi:hypothetical protein